MKDYSPYTSIYLRAPAKKALAELAKRNYRSIADQVELMIAEALARESSQNNATSAPVTEEQPVNAAG